MRAIYELEKADVQKRFGKTQIEDIAAALYSAFHGECRCVCHPFYHSKNGDFDGQLPWSRMDASCDDSVVQAFRLAAIAASEALKSTGVGSYR